MGRSLKNCVGWLDGWMRNPATFRTSRAAPRTSYIAPELIKKTVCLCAVKRMKSQSEVTLLFRGFLEKLTSMVLL